MQLLDPNKPELFKFKFNLKRDQTFYERTHYTVMQYLGDTSALYQALYSISSIILAFVFNI